MSIDRYLGQQPGPRIETRELGEGEYSLELRLPSQPDDAWAAIVGDVLHNVRSALDALAWAAVRRRMERSLTEQEERRLVFPITASADGFRRSAWAPADLPLDVRERFESLQPWADLEGLELTSREVERAIANHPLSLLQRWSNIDKHRGLHPTVCAVDLVYVGLNEGAVSEWHGADPWPWGDGSVIARVRITGEPADTSPEFGHELQVSLEEDALPMRAPRVVDRLTSLLGHADWVLHRLLPLLS